MSETPQYQPGDIVNGYQLTPANEWVPTPQGLQPQGDRWQQPEPAKTSLPPRKSHRGRNIVLITAGAVVGLLIVGSAIGAAATKNPTKQHAASVSTEQSSTPPAPTTTDENTDTTEPTDGNTSTDDGPDHLRYGQSWEFTGTNSDGDDVAGSITVHKVITNLKSSNEFLQPEHGRLWAADITIKVSEGRLDVNPFDWQLQLVDERTYDGDAMADIEPTLHAKTIRAGGSVRGWVVFDIPKTHTSQLQYEAGGEVVAYWTR